MSIYTIDENTQEVSGNLPMAAAVHENALVESVVFEQLSEDKDPILQVTISDGVGGTHREIFWEPDPERISEMAIEYPKTHSRSDKTKGYVEGKEIKPDEAIEIEMENFRQRLKHIATKFVSEEELKDATTGVNSYEEFAQAYADLLNQDVLDAGNPVRVKIALNNKGYTTLPKYPPFIEDMSIPREKSKLKFTKYELNQIEAAKSANADDEPNEDLADSFSDPGTF